MKTRVFPKRLAAVSLAVGLGCMPSLFAQSQSRSSAVGSPPSKLSEQESSPSATDAFSPWTTQILKLSQAGIEDGVILSFIDNTPGTFNLDADQVVDLSHLGVSNGIISAMIQHDSDIAGGWRTVTPSTVPGEMPLHFVVATNEAASPKGDLRAATQAANASTPAPCESKRAEVASTTTRSSRMPVASAAAAPAFADETVSLPNVASKPTPARYSAKKAEPDYRVRDPHPEQIMGPIIVLRGWAPPPNTVLISMFPRSSR